MSGSLDRSFATPYPTRLHRTFGASLEIVRQRFDRVATASAEPVELAAAIRRRANALVARFNIDVVTRGEPPASNERLLWVSNHVSWLDTYVLHTISGARFVAKDEVAAWPIIGTAARRFGTFFHRRGCFRDAWRMSREVGRALAQGYPAAVFPEGTTTDGEVLLPFRNAFFQAAIDAAVPVQPVAIRYLGRDGEPIAPHPTTPAR